MKGIHPPYDPAITRSPGLIKAENKSHPSEDICFLASVDNHPWSYLFDCGKARYLSAGDCKSIRALFVTHTHIDHFCNFDTLLRHQVGLRRVVTVCGPKGIAKNVQGKGRSYTWNLIKRYRPVYEIREIDGDSVQLYECGPPHWDLKDKGNYPLVGGLIFRENNISVRCEGLDHKITSMAYLMEEDSTINIGDFPYRPGPWIKELKEAHARKDGDQLIKIEEGVEKKASDLFEYLYIKEGWKLGYAMDHLASPENHERMRKFFYEANELVIEGFFRECDRDYALRHHHSTASASGQIAREAEVKKLTLVHHSRRYMKEIEDIQEEGVASFEGRQPKFKKEPVARYDKENEGDDSL